MTAGGWPLAGEAHIGDDHSLAYSGFLAGVPPAWNVIRVPKAALNPVQAVLLTAGCRAVRPYTRPDADRALITERHPVPGSPSHGSLNTRVIRVAPVFSRHTLGWC